MQLFFAKLPIHDIPLGGALEQRTGIGLQSSANPLVEGLFFSKLGGKDPFDFFQDLRFISLQSRGGVLFKGSQDDM